MGLDTSTRGEDRPLNKATPASNVGFAWRCSRRNTSVHRLGGFVRSGQSDIEATSGADPVSPRSRRPYVLAFRS